ncbi:MAG: class I SAM-dependent methyltransferase [Pseudonocardiaceae bacterium]
METLFRELTPAQESLFLTLYLRGLDRGSPDPILGDTVSAEIADKIDYDFTRQKVQYSLVLDLALRTKKLDDLIRAFVAKHPNAVVLDLGCGLDPRVLRCDLPSSTDWYDVDFPVVVGIRKRFLPHASHTIGADLTTHGWLDDIPAKRPTMIVADGLMAFLSGHAYQAMTRALTAHFSTGEFAFNAYTPLVMRLGNYSGTFKALHARTAGEGINDPHEPENWGARLVLIEELLLVREPDVAKFPQPLRAFTRLCAHSTRISRHGNRVIRYRF